MNKENKMVYSTNSLEHSFNVIGESCDDWTEEVREIIIKENVCACGKEEIYHERLTNNMCLTCYHNYQDDLREMESDWEDYLL